MLFTGKNNKKIHNLILFVQSAFKGEKTKTKTKNKKQKNPNKQTKKKTFTKVYYAKSSNIVNSENPTYEQCSNIFMWQIALTWILPFLKFV